MSNKAFDTEKKVEVHADDCVSSYRGRYICNLCYKKGKTVPVYIREIDGRKTFVSYAVDEHLEGCQFPIHQSYTNIYEPTFERGTLLDRLSAAPSINIGTSQKRSSTSKSLSHSSRPTLKWLYNVCVSNDKKHEFAPGCTVENSCLKKDTLHYWYDKDKTAYPLLIIGTIKSFDKDAGYIQIAIGKYTVNAVFDDKNMILKFLHECKVQNGKSIESGVYIYGQLSDNKSKNFYQEIKINSRKQLGIER